MANYIYLAVSLDGYMADINHSVDWLDKYIKAPEGSDMGYEAHMSKIDALVMGRNTVEFVLNAGVDWPYKKPVFVVTNSWTQVPEGFEDKLFIVKGKPKEIVDEVASKGYHNLYIDGGVVITDFLEADLIDEMIITTTPVLLGDGVRLFGKLSEHRFFKHVKSERFNETVSQDHYVRQR